MQRYFINKDIQESFSVDGSDAFHMSKVLRMKLGDIVEVVSNGKLYSASILSITQDKVDLKVLEEKSNNSELDIDIHLYMSLLKKDKFEWVIQKATELGVKSITPVISERTVVKVDPTKEGKKRLRWETIAKEAAEQSKRLKIPSINQITKLNDIIKNNGLSLVAFEEESNNLTQLKTSLKTNFKEIHIFIGPEGGISQKEIEFLKSINFKVVGLGKRILRAETSPIMLISTIIYEKELQEIQNVKKN